MHNHSALSLQGKITAFPSHAGPKTRQPLAFYCLNYYDGPLPQLSHPTLHSACRSHFTHLLKPHASIQHMDYHRSHLLQSLKPHASIHPQITWTFAGATCSTFLHVSFHQHVIYEFLQEPLAHLQSFLKYQLNTDTYLPR